MNNHAGNCAIWNRHVSLGCTCEYKAQKKTVQQLHEECNDLYQHIAVQEAVLSSLNNKFCIVHAEYLKALEAESLKRDYQNLSIKFSEINKLP